jgi:chromosome segregation ATPase
MAYHYPLNRPYISAYDAPIDYAAQRVPPPAPAYYAPPVAPLAAPAPQSDHERMASLLERENASLRQELKTSRDKTAETLTELTRCRDELRQASSTIEELQREVARARDAVGRSENLKLAEAQAEVSLLRQEVRSRDSHIAAQTDQLRAESERLRGCSEQLEQSRRELEDLRSKLKIASDRAEGVQTQVRDSKKSEGEEDFAVLAWLRDFFFMCFFCSEVG